MPEQQQPWPSQLCPPGLAPFRAGTLGLQICIIWGPFQLRPCPEVTPATHCEAPVCARECRQARHAPGTCPYPGHPGLALAFTPAWTPWSASDFCLQPARLKSPRRRPTGLGLCSLQGPRVPASLLWVGQRCWGHSVPLVVIASTPVDYALLTPETGPFPGCDGPMHVTVCSGVWEYEGCFQRGCGGSGAPQTQAEGAKLWLRAEQGWPAGPGPGRGASAVGYWI